MTTKRLLVPLLAAAALLGACAGPAAISTEVSSYGEWPAGRAPGSYGFDRLPSQQALAEETGKIETAARAALEKAGFKPAAEGQTPDVLVQVGATTVRSDRQPWDDPLWWRGGFGYWHRYPWGGPGWSVSATYDRPRYDRQVAVLLRDRASGKPLFESRASSDGGSPPNAAVLAALFEAALVDFPQVGLNPRKVVVTLNR